MVSRARKLADALGLAREGGRDPEDPAYKFHSQEILATMEGLQTSFGKKKQEIDTEWAATEGTYNELEQSLQGQIDAHAQAIKQLKESVLELKGTMAEQRTALLEAESLL